MSATTKEASQVAVSRTAKDYLDLEVPIREVTFMAGIARDLAYELLDLEVNTWDAEGGRQRRDYPNEQARI